MCLSGATCLPADSCFRGIKLENSNSVRWSSTKQTSSSHLIVDVFSSTLYNTHSIHFLTGYEGNITFIVP